MDDLHEEERALRALHEQQRSRLQARIGARVHELRKQVGLSQERLAEKAKLSTGYIGGLERGERNLSTSSLARIAVALELEIGSLFPSLSELTSIFADESEE